MCGSDSKILHVKFNQPFLLSKLFLKNQFCKNKGDSHEKNRLLILLNDRATQKIYFGIQLKNRNDKKMPLSEIIYNL